MTDNSEKRKATDVLLSIEQKLDVLLGTITNHGFAINIVSNKLNELLKSKEQVAPKFTAETVNIISTIDSTKNIPIAAEDALPIETHPTGFRRTSRPETFAGDNAYLKKAPKEMETTKFPIQIPKGDKSEIIVPNQALQQNAAQPPKQPQKFISSSSIPVSQRIVDKNGKSVFLADVDIIDNNTTQSLFKTRTNGTGKWMASLPAGDYTVVLRKRDSLTKDPLEIKQNIQVDGIKNPLELPVCIIKN